MISPELHLKLEQIIKNNIQGASYLVLSFLEALEKELVNHHGKNERKIIIETLKRIEGSHQEMIEFKNVIRILRSNPSRKNVQGIRRDYLTAKKRVAELLTKTLNELETRNILTLSHSSLVENALLHWGGVQEPTTEIQIHILESRPMKEGRILLMNLSNMIKNARFFYWVDAAMGLAISKVDCVLLGMDRWYSDGCITNKIGSLPLAMLARERNLPVIVLGTSFKKSDERCPHNVKKHKESVKPPFEVLDKESIEKINHSRVEVMNFYFELVNGQYLSKIITEHGIIRK